MLRKQSLSGIERLENKALLACDMAFNGEVLNIQCDGADDFVNVLSQSDILSVDIGDGNGLVEIGSAENLKKLKVRTGAGNDQVVLTGVTVSDDIRVRTGRGDDIVTISLGNIGDDLKIRTAGGDDRVNLLGVTVGDSADVRLGRGDDTIEAVPFLFSPGLSAGGDIDIDGMNGNDTVIGEANFAAGDVLDFDNIEIFS